MKGALGLGGAFASAALALAALAAPGGGTRRFRATDWEDPYECAGCHWERFADWSTSQMGRAYTGDFFQAQYRKLALPDADRDPAVAGIRADCIGCHSPSAYLTGEIPPDPARRPDSAWDAGPRPGVRHGAERGVFCDFCHTIDRLEAVEPFNHNYVSAATPAVDPKRADLEFPWSPHHKTLVSELHESAELCGICHNERNPFGVWVKATHREWSETPYARRGIPCQTCHVPPREGKPAKMGPERPWNHRHWFGGGFSTFVEGAARVKIELARETVRAGDTVTFRVAVGDISTGHKFPTGASEERDVWLRVGLCDGDGRELQHIPIPPNPADPNDRYFITSNAKEAHPTRSGRAEPIARDALPEGDRLYHSAFLDPDGKFTYAQWYAAKEIENRLSPGETRIEEYSWTVPKDAAGRRLFLKASLWYRRMPDSYAEFLGIPPRPRILVAEDERPIAIVSE